MRYLFLNWISAYQAGETRHAQTVMRELGFKVLVARPESLFDGWYFEVEDFSFELPSYITEVKQRIKG